MSHAIKLLLLILMSVVTTQLLSGRSYLDVVGISRLQYFWSSNTSTLLSWSLCLQFPCLACASHIQLLIIQTQPKCHLNLFPTSRVCLAGPPWTFTQSELSSRANAMKPSITDLYRQWPALLVHWHCASLLIMPMSWHFLFTSTVTWAFSVLS